MRFAGSPDRTAGFAGKEWNQALKKGKPYV